MMASKERERAQERHGGRAGSKEIEPRMARMARILAVRGHGKIAQKGTKETKGNVWFENREILEIRESDGC